ncbi:hypothetical protein CRUP_026820 [Coryphaenoides rupestris]|nr:hypothetical protein CRUP_026820 [Coryphaenoides rupestris]
MCSVVDDIKKDLSMEFSALPDPQDCMTLESTDAVLLKPPSTSSRISDKSFPSTGQRFHFSKDRVRHVLEGGNSLVFTYGVTNTGKTFTFLGPEGDAGLLPRALHLVFHSVGERVSPHMGVKPQHCRDYSLLTREQQAEEALAKRNLLRQLKEVRRPAGPSVLGSLLEDSVSLDVDPDTSFSIWVSFCEIYNENIHDLLEAGPPGPPRRAALRLSQDIKGNSFVKDLRWVQVNSAEEALKVINHSIFSIRILRVDQATVHGISELSLCDLAGSERCAKTQNRGERLKEAGNINTSLLTLGKCINALRHNQQSKQLQQVPFRESKLTHYLQSFFLGRGRACMIVNVNQCASMYDETLNVLKFSAVAQKVVVLTSKTLLTVPQRSAREVSILINNADRKALGHRRSSLMGWENSLEDVQEDDDEDEDEDNESVMEDTMQEDSIEEDDVDQDKVVVFRKTYQKQLALLKELQKQSAQLEECVRVEVSAEFSKLFSKMEADYEERLEREKMILEERAETRLEIFKNLVKRLTSPGSSQEKKDTPVAMDMLMIDSMSGDLAGIKQAAQATLSCLGDQRPDQLEVKLQSLDQQLKESRELLAAKTAELDHSNTELDQTRQTLESRDLRMSQLMEMCQEKDDIISRLQKTMDEQMQQMASLNSVREEVLRLRLSRPPGEEEKKEVVVPGCGPHKEQVSGSRKRRGESQVPPDGQPPSKKGTAPSETSGRAAGWENTRERLSMTDSLWESSPVEARKEVKLVAEEVLAELHAERRAREDVLVALEEQTIGKEEALASLKEAQRGKEEVLASLKEVQRGKEEALASLKEAQRGKEEALASLKEVQRGKEEALASLKEERRGKAEALASLEEERRGKEEALASLEERRGKEEALASLEEERRGEEKVLASLEEERRGNEKALTSLEEERRGKEEALASLEDERRGKEEALASLEEERRGKEEALASLEEEKEEAREEARPLIEGGEGKARRGFLASHRRRGGEARRRRWASLEEEKRGKEEALASVEEERRGKEEALASLEEERRGKEKALASLEEERRGKEEALASLEEERRGKEEALASVEEERKGKEEALASLEEERRGKEEALASLEEERRGKEKALASLEEERRGKEEALASLEEERRGKEEAQRTKEESAEQTSEQLQEARAQEERHQEQIQERDLHIHKLEQEVLALKQEAETAKAAAGAESGCDQLREEMSELKRNLLREEEENKKRKRQMEDLEQEASLAKEQLVESQREQQGRRRELLAVAEQAIAEKDAELERRGLELHRLKEQSTLDSDRAKGLAVDLHRRDEETADLREKLADSKRQIQQVHKEVSSMREGEKALTQKLADAEKSRKQLQSELSGRDRTIQQLTKNTQLYQKACQDLEAQQQVMEDMQLDELKDSENRDNTDKPTQRSRQSEELHQAKQEVVQAQESLKESVSAELEAKEQAMEEWRRERDSLVAALEVQLQKLLSSNAEQEKLIQQLRSDTRPPPEVSVQQPHSDARPPPEVRVQQPRSDTLPPPEIQTEGEESPAAECRKPLASPMRSSAERSSLDSAGFPTVLESSQISTENGRRSRFPQPEMEISFSPLQPNRLALRRQGEQDSVTVKITRSARKRRTTEMERDDIENRRGTKNKLTPHQEET